jgi:hypothetical protein
MDTIEVHEGHEVTQAAISVNIGSGLLEAMRVDPHAYRGGDIIDVVCRIQIGRIGYQPVNKTDYDGAWKRIHTGIPLAAVPVDNVTVARILDAHIAKVGKRRELPGQASIDDEINQLDAKRAEKAIKKPAKKRVKAAPKNTPAGLDGDE